MWKVPRTANLVEPRVRTSEPIAAVTHASNVPSRKCVIPKVLRLIHVSWLSVSPLARSIEVNLPAGRSQRFCNISEIASTVLGKRTMGKP